MRFLLPLILLAACSGSDPAADDDAGTDAPPGYRLVWSDEFNDGALDTATWTHWVTGNPYNNELQYYTSRRKNSYVEDGALHLVAFEEEYTDTDGTRSYTSARINTKGTADFLYGRFEIRARMPVGQGIWPAIWMMPTDDTYGGWPNSGEIDIMEYLGHDPDRTYGTLHYARSGGGHQYTGDSYELPAGDFDDDFHVFALEWDKTQIRWYVDDVLFQSQSSWQTRDNPFPAPFNQRFHFILNVAVGGDWPGSPNDRTQFPQQMVVDYVRAYERE